MHQYKVVQDIDAAVYNALGLEKVEFNSPRIIRPREDQSCWYRAWEFSGRKGKYLFFIGSDWADMQKHYFVQPPDADPQPAETVIKSMTEEVMSWLAKDRENEAALAAAKAEKLLKLFDGGGHSEYLDRKGVKDVKCLVSKEGNVFLPMLGPKGHIVGGQTIYPDGKKRFLPGQANTGAHYIIEGAPEQVYLCEGFATGATIHLATGATVYVAFNCHNLKHVAEIIPVRPFIIAADDDAFTSGNPGLTAAKKLSNQLNMPYTFPVFKEQQKGMTDFNDLMIAEGLEAVLSQLDDTWNGVEVVTKFQQFESDERELDWRDVVNRTIVNDTFLSDSFKNMYVYSGSLWHQLSTGQIEMIANTKESIHLAKTNRKKEIINMLINKSIYTAPGMPAEKAGVIPWNNLPMDAVAFKNGVYQNGKLRPHKDDDFLTYTFQANYNQAAVCPVWKSCLDKWFPTDGFSEEDIDNQGKRLLLQQFMGAVMLPKFYPKKALLCYGESDTGKSLVDKVLRQIVGERMSQVSFADMSSPRGMAPLKNSLLNVINELGSMTAIDDAGFKRLVSTGEAIPIDQKYREPELIAPMCKLLIISNQLPVSQDDSSGVTNRLLCLHFKNVIPYEDQDPFLFEKLQKEIDGIAMWCLQGVEQLKMNKWQFTEPLSSQSLIRDIKRSNNPVLSFLDDWYEYVPGYKISMDEIWRDYCAYAGHTRLDRMKFTYRLKAYASNINRANWDGLSIYCCFGLKPGPSSKAYCKFDDYQDGVKEAKTIKAQQLNWRGIKDD